MTGEERMRAAEAAVPVSMLRELLDYDPETGGLTWRPRHEGHFAGAKNPAGHAAAFNSTFAGRPAGCFNTHTGYQQVSIFDRLFRSHRVAYALAHGCWPGRQIDHKNGVRTDNRLANLRVVDNATNGRNKAKFSSNSSGFTGVSWNKKSQKWQAHVTIDGKQEYLGLFESLSEAAANVRIVREVTGYDDDHGRENPTPDAVLEVNRSALAAKRARKAESTAA